MDDDTLIRITFRMPRELHAKVATAAQASNRSMNAEIIARLENSLVGTAENALPDSRALLAELTGILDEREERLLSELRSLLQSSRKQD